MSRMNNMYAYDSFKKDLQQCDSEEKANAIFNQSFGNNVEELLDDYLKSSKSLMLAYVKALGFYINTEKNADAALSFLKQTTSSGVTATSKVAGYHDKELSAAYMALLFKLSQQNSVAVTNLLLIDPPKNNPNVKPYSTLQEFRSDLDNCADRKSAVRIFEKLGDNKAIYSMKLILEVSALSQKQRSPHNLSFMIVSWLNYLAPSYSQGVLEFLKQKTPTGKFFGYSYVDFSNTRSFDLSYLFMNLMTQLSEQEPESTLDYMGTIGLNLLSQDEQPEVVKILEKFVSQYPQKVLKILEKSGSLIRQGIVHHLPNDKKNSAFRSYIKLLHHFAETDPKKVVPLLGFKSVYLGINPYGNEARRLVIGLIEKLAPEMTKGDVTSFSMCNRYFILNALHSHQKDNDAQQFFYDYLNLLAKFSEKHADVVANMMILKKLSYNRCLFSHLVESKENKLVQKCLELLIMLSKGQSRHIFGFLKNHDGEIFHTKIEKYQNNNTKQLYSRFLETLFGKEIFKLYQFVASKKSSLIKPKYVADVLWLDENIDNDLKPFKLLGQLKSDKKINDKEIAEFFGTFVDPEFIKNKSMEVRKKYLSIAYQIKDIKTVYHCVRFGEFSETDTDYLQGIDCRVAVLKHINDLSNHEKIMAYHEILDKTKSLYHFFDAAKHNNRRDQVENELSKLEIKSATSLSNESTTPEPVMTSRSQRTALNLSGSTESKGDIVLSLNNANSDDSVKLYPMVEPTSTLPLDPLLSHSNANELDQSSLSLTDTVVVLQQQPSVSNDNVTVKSQAPSAPPLGDYIVTNELNNAMPLPPMHTVVSQQQHLNSNFGSTTNLFPNNQPGKVGDSEEKQGNQDARTPVAE